MLSEILMRQPFRHPGTPRRLLSPSSGVHALSLSTSASNSSQSSDSLPDKNSVVLGLRTLGTFDFDGHSLLQFVQHCADNYLHSKEPLIQLEAVRTCSSLLKGSLLGHAGMNSPTVMTTINKVSLV